jgi:ssDNA-binding Zn-finger/Zn-ribbon topoisomerase 1
MERKVNRWGNAFLACTGFKDKHCSGTVSLSKSGEPLWPVESTVPCPDCETMLVVKRSRRGKFLACPRYPKCRGTLSLPACTHKSRTGKACGKPMTVPGPKGTMICKTHTNVKLKPKPPRSKSDEKGDDPDKKATVKKATAKKTSAKKAAAKKATKARS